MAWHAAETVRDLARHDRSQPAATLRSTLDAHWQAELEAMAATYADSEGPDVHVTLMVIENRSRAVRALVGSAGRERPGGWIDLTDRLRSPGSTLKPFIYGLAMDEGSADLFTVLSDAPHRFSDYAPNNFDRTFRGEVRLADALGYSLNVPAVHALDRIGPDRFIAALDQAGTRPVVRRAREDGRVGLAVALGGLGFTARDLAVLYAGLDEGGIMRPLQWFEADAKPPEVARLLGADTAARLVRAMREAPAPPGFAPAQLLQARDAVAFKTGTSYGFRDAWAVGLADGHTVVVWVGRADARPRPGTTGRQTAAPILFDVFARIARMRQDTRAGPVLEGPRGDAVARFTGEAAPHILFPPEDATIILDRTSNHGFVLAAQGSGPFTWYVDGSPVPRDAARQSVWRPQGGGFYRLEVVDAHGRTSSLKVRVKATS